MSIAPVSATITFNTNEPATGTVRYGLSCGSFLWSASGSEGQTSHTINLTGLMDETTYYFVVDAEDEAGNQATDDNGGSCYTFSTPDVPSYFTEQFDGDFDLDGFTVVLMPDGSGGFYGACGYEIVALPTDPAELSRLALLLGETGGSVGSLRETYRTFSLRVLGSCAD